MPLYGWLVLALLAIALVVLALVLQRRRRAGGVISTRQAKRGRRR